MIQRIYIECLTCEQEHILRVQIGTSSCQKHELFCTNCEQKIKISLNLNQSQGFIESINTDENCKLIKSDDITNMSQTPIRYLSSDIQVTEGAKNCEFSFPAMEILHRFESKLKAGEITSLPERDIVHITKQWGIIKKAWSLSRSGHTELSKKEIKKYNDIKNLDNIELDNALFEFSISYLKIDPYMMPKLDKAIDWVLSIDRSSLRELSSYLNEVNKEHMRRYFETFTDFFENYNIFGQVQFSNFYPENYTVTTNSFDDVKMFYGSCFEHIGSNIETLTCANNIKNNRKYNELEKIDLDTYNSIDKKGRLKTFDNTPEIKDLFISYDNKLRNASHHGRILCSGDIVKYKLAGSTDYTEITYTQYLIECKNIFNSMCVMLILELIIKKRVEKQKVSLRNAVAEAMYNL